MGIVLMVMTLYFSILMIFTNLFGLKNLVLYKISKLNSFVIKKKKKKKMQIKLKITRSKEI